MKFLCTESAESRSRWNGSSFAWMQKVGRYPLRRLNGFAPVKPSSGQRARKTQLSSQAEDNLLRVEGTHSKVVSSSQPSVGSVTLSVPPWRMEMVNLRRVLSSCLAPPRQAAKARRGHPNSSSRSENPPGNRPVMVVAERGRSSTWCAMAKSRMTRSSTVDSPGTTCPFGAEKWPTGSLKRWQTRISRP